jgi:hypothetical protein
MTGNQRAPVGTVDNTSSAWVWCLGAMAAAFLLLAEPGSGSSRRPRKYTIASCRSIRRSTAGCAVWGGPAAVGCGGRVRKGGRAGRELGTCLSASVCNAGYGCTSKSLPQPELSSRS